MFDREVVWGLAYALFVSTAWFLVLSAVTREEGPTYCYIETFDALAAASALMHHLTARDLDADGGRIMMYQPLQDEI